MLSAGHDGKIYTVAWSPDGRRVASGGDDATVRIWDADGPHAPLAVLRGHQGAVMSLAWSPDGRLAASGASGLVWIWDPEPPGVALEVLTSCSGLVGAVAWSPDGRRLASAGACPRHDAGPAVQIWDPDEPGEALAELGSSRYVDAVAWSPDGRRVAWANGFDRDVPVEVWDVGDPSRPRAVVDPGKRGRSVRALAWSPGGRRLACGEAGGDVVVWDPDAGRKPWPVGWHNGFVNSVAWSPDGLRLASGGGGMGLFAEQGTVRVWDVDTRNGLRAELSGMGHQVRSVAWAPDGRRLACDGVAGTVAVWDPQRPGDTQFVPGATVVLWNASGVAHDQARVIGLARGVCSVAWSPDDRRLATGCIDGTVVVRDPGVGGEAPIAVGGHRGGATTVTWSPDGKRLASAGGDATVAIWNLRTPGVAPAVLGGHDGALSVAWSPDGHRVAAGGTDGTVSLWDPESPGEPVATLTGHSGRIWSVAWSPDGRRVAAGGTDGTVSLWDPASPGEPVAVCVGSAEAVVTLAWSPDGRRLASAGDGRGVRVWNLGSAAEPLVVPAGTVDPVFALAWSPDGTRLAYGTENLVRILDFRSGRMSDHAHFDAGSRVCAIAWRQERIAVGTAGGWMVLAEREDGTLATWDPGVGDARTERADDEIMPGVGVVPPVRTADGAAGARVSAASGELHGVPDPPPRYFERAAELDELQSALVAAGGGGGQSGPIPLGLCGPGGVGKSVLAAVAARSAAVREAFGDGIYWVVLGDGPDAARVAQATLARHIGIDTTFTTAEQGRQALRELLGERRALVVVDDVCSAGDAEALLVTGAEGRTLVTARQPLAAWFRARWVPIGSLGTDDARRFLGQVTGCPQLPAQAEVIIDAFGGTADDLALVGAAIASGVAWPTAAAQMSAAQLTGRANGEAGDGDGEGRSRSMPVAFDALDADDAARYLELAVFPRGAAAPVVTVARLWQHTAALDDRDTSRQLSRLATRNLVTVDRDRVMLSGRQRAFLQLHNPDRVGAHRQLLAAHRDTPTLPGYWNTLGDDEPYLWDHLIGHLLASGDTVAAQTLTADPLWLLRRFHLGGAYAPEGDLGRVIAAAPGNERAERLLRRWRQASGALASVKSLADRALTLASQVGDLIDSASLAVLFPPVGLAPTREAGEEWPGLQLEMVHRGHVSQLAWSPDGRRLAAGDYDTVRVWDADSRNLWAAMRDRADDSVSAVAWSPDGRRLASATVPRSVTGGETVDAMLRVWDADSGAPLAAMGGHQHNMVEVLSLAWSPDGRRLASAGNDGVVTVETTIAARIPGIDPAGTTRISAVETRTTPPRVRLWDPESGELLAEMAGHHGTLTSLEWSPDGRQLASSGDSTIRIWDPDTPGEALAAVGGGELGPTVSCPAWSPDGQRLASLGGNDSVLLWDTAAPSTPTVLPRDASAGALSMLDWSPDGRRLAAVDYNGGGVWIWDPDRPGEPPLRRASHDDGVNALCWSPDSRRYATAGRDASGANTVRVWDSEAPSEPHPAPGRHHDGISSVHWSPDGRRLATAGGDHHSATATIRDAVTGEVLAVLQGNERGTTVSSVAWSPDGTRVAVGAYDTVGVWDPDLPDRPQALFAAHHGQVFSLAWSPDGRRVASGGHGPAVWVWEPDIPGKPPIALAGHIHDPMTVNSVAWSPDGRRVAVGGFNFSATMRRNGHPDVEVVLDKVRIWDPDTPARPITELAGHLNGAFSVAWSPSGQQLASAGGDATVRIWDPHMPGQPQGELAGHDGPVTTVTWSPEERRLASAGHDRTVRIWDLESRTQLCALGIGTTVNAIAWHDERVAVATPRNLTILRVQDLHGSATRHS